MSTAAASQSRSPAPLEPTIPDCPPPFAEARHLSFSHAGEALLNSLSFTIGPGLTLVRGGDGRGKTTLLRLLAGQLTPGSGVLRRQAGSTYFQDPADPLHDPVIASAWLEALRPGLPDWHAESLPGLVDAFGLAEHLHKPMFMLSTGSRRKVGLVGAVAGRARLTLVDNPFAALDAASCRTLTRVLAEAAGSEDRAWVIADFECPAGLQGTHLTGLIDLGD